MSEAEKMTLEQNIEKLMQIMEYGKMVQRMQKELFNQNAEIRPLVVSSRYDSIHLFGGITQLAVHFDKPLQFEDVSEDVPSTYRAYFTNEGIEYFQYISSEEYKNMAEQQEATENKIALVS